MLVGLGAALGVGACTGLWTTLLLFALAYVTDLRAAHAWLILGLAPAGGLIAYLYARADVRLGRGTGLILDEIHDPSRPLPRVMAPLIGVTTVLTHLVGGSAGREGSAVQIGGAVGEAWAARARLGGDARRTLLAAGMSAGFAAAIGTPFAGALFGLEVLGRGAWRGRAIAAAALAAAASAVVAHLLHAPHTHFAFARFDPRQPELAPVLIAAGLAFGLVARLFVALTHALEAAYARAGLRTPWPHLVGGTILSMLLLGLNLTAYAGLGLDVIQRALVSPANAAAAPTKLLLTVLTLASGFKGGEFIPLVFIGTTLGSWLASFVPSVPLAALGFAAVFGAAANTPVACAVMAAELFGARLFVPALVTCYVAHLVSGHPGIYKGQPAPPFKGFKSP